MGRPCRRVLLRGLTFYPKNLRRGSKGKAFTKNDRHRGHSFRGYGRSSQIQRKQKE